MRDACLTLRDGYHAWSAQQNHLHLQRNLHRIRRVSHNRLDFRHQPVLKRRLGSFDGNEIVLRECRALQKELHKPLLIDRRLQEITADVLKPTSREKGNETPNATYTERSRFPSNPIPDSSVATMF